MDLVTGAQVTVAVVVPVARERMWELITAVHRIGEWSPETTGAAWCDGTPGPAPGARVSRPQPVPERIPGRAPASRLGTLCRNMSTTIGAMAATDSARGAA